MAVISSTTFAGIANGSPWPAPWSWRHGNNANAKAYVQDGFGRVYVAGAGQWLDKGYITHTTAPSDFEITLRLRGTTDSFPQVHWRTQGSSGEVSSSYCVLFDWDGKVHLYRNVNWTSTKLSSVTGRFSYNTWTRLRLRVQGSNFKARIWKDGASEPSTWDMDVTDSAHSSGALVLQGAGGAATSGFNIDFDDIVVSDFSVATTPVTIPSSAYPTATNVDGVSEDKITLIKVTGVTWTVDGVDYPSSSMTSSKLDVPYGKGTNTTVSAKASSSAYTLSGTTEWTLTFTNYVPPPPPVITEAPTVYAVAVNEDGFAEDDPDQDFSDVDLDTEADFVGQGPEMEWINDYGPEVSSLIQINLPDFESVALFASEADLVYPMLMAQEMVPDMLDDMDVENIQLEMDDTAQDVPYEYMYWLHGVDEFPDNAPTAPPESGDVDPETGELVP